MVKVSYTDKGVRDNPQSAIFNNGIITIRNKFGKKTISKLKFKEKDYLNYGTSFNKDFNKTQFLIKKNKNLDMINPLHVRIIDSQRRAIAKVIVLAKQ